MSVSIDGGPTVAFRPGLQSDPLAVGPHRFVLFPGAQIAAFYEPSTTIEVTIEAGRGEQVVNLAPRLKQAALEVVTPGLRALVEVHTREGDRLAQGPTNRVVFFDPPSAEGGWHVRVTAPGYAVWDEVRSFTAGGNTVSVRPELIPEGEVAAGP
jgi:hypothetical protein